MNNFNFEYGGLNWEIPDISANAVYDLSPKIFLSSNGIYVEVTGWRESYPPKPMGFRVIPTGELMQQSNRKTFVAKIVTK